MSPLCQKIRGDKRKIVATSDFHKKSNNCIIRLIQQLHQLGTHLQSPEGGTELIIKVRGHDLISRTECKPTDEPYQAVPRD